MMMAGILRENDTINDKDGDRGDRKRRDRGHYQSNKNEGSSCKIRRDDVQPFLSRWVVPRRNRFITPDKSNLVATPHNRDYDNIAHADKHEQNEDSTKVAFEQKQLSRRDQSDNHDMSSPSQYHNSGKRNHDYSVKNDCGSCKRLCCAQSWDHRFQNDGWSSKRAYTEHRNGHNLINLK